MSLQDLHFYVAMAGTVAFAGSAVLSVADRKVDLFTAVVLGLGTQVRAHVERRFSMPFDHPAARITDYVRCLRAIWDSFQTGTMPAYKGPFYQCTLLNPYFDPGPIDGKVGAQTMRAVENFQRRKGLERGGLTFSTLEALGVKI